jgi:hypothetical protein
MPKLRPPHVASPDEVRITRSGDYAIIEYADPAVATTHFKIGADHLDEMSDDELLEYWNEHVQASEEFARRQNFVATEIPIGKPQVEYSTLCDQWVPRGHVLRCQVLTDAALPSLPDEPFVNVDGRDFNLSEFVKMVGTFGGWGMRITFVPQDATHVAPKLRVKEPPSTKRVSKRRRISSKS